MNSHSTIQGNTETKDENLFPGATYAFIKNSNRLYFTYDPRGSKDGNADERYCPDCRCLKNYCSKIVMGDIVVYTVDLHVENLGILHHVFDGRGIEVLFNKYYSKQVHQKMLENGLGEEKGYDNTTHYTIPACMKPILMEARDKLYKSREAAQINMNKSRE